MRQNKEGYYVNRHSCFLLQYQLVLVTKYRKPVITGQLEERLKEYTKAYFEEQGIKIQALETMPDHMHILFDAPPQINLANYINAFKSASSRIMRKEFEKQIGKYYREPCLWSLSYFIGTVSDRSAEAVKHYINTQKE